MTKLGHKLTALREGSAFDNSPSPRCVQVNHGAQPACFHQLIVYINIYSCQEAARRYLASSSLRSRGWRSPLSFQAYDNAIMPEDLESTEAGHLIDELIMLGLCNLYREFQPQRTLELYARLVPIFAEAGVTLPKDPDLSGW
jgi:hypothetical protein